jgi:acetyltransferase
MVRSDMKGRGLGYALMQEMLAWARERGLARVIGEVLPENSTMLKMARELGAAVAPISPDGRSVRVTFDLAAPLAAASV